MDPREKRPPVIFDEDSESLYTDTLTLAREVLRRAPSISSVAPMPRRVSEPPPPPPAVSLELAPIDGAVFDARYETRSVLGEGGMGAVFLCKDRNVGREVAMKVMRAEHSDRADLKARFEREARVQGQLEHPSVVPVYDLGIKPDGSEYFTMKRLRGLTFHEIVWMLKQGDLHTMREFPRRRLLGAFASVCQAVAFAHSRGVLHRDLKPSNVMVGSFGEVHILDWGLAKIVGEKVADEGAESVESESDHETFVGEVVGTAGYMSPEQVRGEIDQLDARSDVYALGAILFELLTLERLHAGDTPVAVLASTLGGADAQASKRAPHRNVPPDLEAICVRATAFEPANRHATVRELLADVERYLDDNRGTERRREQAAEHGAAALEEAQIARAGGPGATAARERAVQEASAALAYDPVNRDAMSVLSEMLLRAPPRVTPEARTEFEAARRAAAQRWGRATLAVQGAWMALVASAAALGVRDVRVAAALGGLLAVTFGLSWLASRGRLSEGARFAAYVAGIAAIGLAGLILGWAILVPGMAAMHATSFLAQADRKRAQPALLLAALTVIAPFALEAFGLMPRSYAFEGGAMRVLPHLTHLPDTRAPLFLLASSLGVILGPALLAGRLRWTLAAEEERSFMHRWNLRRLAPTEEP